jgi:hypothetical protein
MGKVIIGLRVPVAALILIGAAIAYVFADRKTIVAEASDPEARFLVIGDSSELISGWNMSLCWCRPGGYWMFYYLDHETPLWRDVDLLLDAQRVVVRRGGKEIGRLTRSDAAFRSSVRDEGQRTPHKIIASSDPFDSSALFYRGSPQWDDLWSVARGSRQGD